MPEGPEVAVITKGLNNVLKNKYLFEIQITTSSRYREKKPDGFNKLSQLLNNSKIKIKEVKCKGKLIYFILDNNTYIINRLGMSGFWSHKPGKHTSIIIHYGTQKQTLPYKLYFIDQRHFGLLKILFTKKELDEQLAKIGPDLLNEKVSLNEYLKIMEKHKNKNVCKVMMDQTIMSGIGNYLKAEILYEARVSPFNKVGNIPTEYLHKMYIASIKIIKKSFMASGNSLQHYRDINSVKGEFEFKLKVYGRKSDQFLRKVVRTKTPDGRNTYYVPSIQIEF